MKFTTLFCGCFVSIASFLPVSQEKDGDMIFQVLPRLAEALISNMTNDDMSKHKDAYVELIRNISKLQARLVERPRQIAPILEQPLHRMTQYRFLPLVSAKSETVKIFQSAVAVTPPAESGAYGTPPEDQEFVQDFFDWLDLQEKPLSARPDSQAVKDIFANAAEIFKKAAVGLGNDAEAGEALRWIQILWGMLEQRRLLGSLNLMAIDVLETALWIITQPRAKQLSDPWKRESARRGLLDIRSGLKADNDSQNSFTQEAFKVLNVFVDLKFRDGPEPSHRRITFADNLVNIIKATEKFRQQDVGFEEFAPRTEIAIDGKFDEEGAFDYKQKVKMLKYISEAALVRDTLHYPLQSEGKQPALLKVLKERLVSMTNLAQLDLMLENADAPRLVQEGIHEAWRNMTTDREPFGGAEGLKKFVEFTKARVTPVRPLTPEPKRHASRSLRRSNSAPDLMPEVPAESAFATVDTRRPSKKAPKRVTTNIPKSTLKISSRPKSPKMRRKITFL